MPNKTIESADIVLRQYRLQAGQPFLVLGTSTSSRAQSQMFHFALQRLLVVASASVVLRLVVGVRVV